MKKAILLLLSAAFAALLCALAGCSTTYCYITAESDGVAALCDEDNMDSLSSSSGESGFSVRLGVVMYNYYDADTLKVFANGEPVEFTKNPDYDADAPFTERQIAGTVFFESVREDISVTFECEEKEISFTFGVNKNNGETVAEALKEFRFKDGTTIYQALTSEKYSYKTTWSEYIEGEGIAITGAKIGTYRFYKSVDMIDTNLLVNYDYRIGPLMTAERNRYVLFVPTQGLGTVNEVLFNADAVTENRMDFQSLSGDIVRFNNGSYISSQEIRELDTVSLGLHALDGVDLDQVKVYINDTEVLSGGEAKYQFSSEMLPIDYVSDENLADFYESQATTFSIRVENAVCSEAAGLKQVSVNTTQTISFEGQYYSNGNIAWYEEIISFDNPFAAAFSIESPNDLSYDLTISLDGTEVKFEGSEIKALQSFDAIYQGDFVIIVNSFSGNDVTGFRLVLRSGAEVDQDMVITLE